MATKEQYDNYAERSLDKAGITTKKDDLPHLFEGTLIEDYERTRAIIRVAKSVKRAMEKELKGRGIL